MKQDWTVWIGDPYLDLGRSPERDSCWETDLLGIRGEVKVRVTDRPRLIVRIFHRLCFGLKWRHVDLREEN